MLFVDDQPVDLDLDPRPAVGREIVQRPPDRPSLLSRLGRSLLRTLGSPSGEAKGGPEVVYGLDDVRLIKAGLPPRVLEDPWSHELAAWAPRRLRFLVEARQQLRGERPDSLRRAALELAALHREDFPEANKVYVAWLPQGLHIFAGEESARQLRREDITVWAVVAARDGHDGTWRPKLGKRWAQRYEIPYGQS